MASARWRLPVVWLGALVGTYLATLDDAELWRYAIRRQAVWGMLCSTALFLYLTGTGPTVGPEGTSIVGWAAATFGVVASLLATIRLRATLDLAVIDRNSAPAASGGAVRRVIASREGGWPLLLRDRDGHWLWLTGHERDLRRLRAKLASRRPGSYLELRITVTYYPRTRVIKEITGMTVEEREVARGFVPRFATSPGG
jgi:hypothetical protein